MMSNIYGIPGASACQGAFGPNGDPMGPLGTTGAYVPRSEATAQNGGERAEPQNWHNLRGSH